MLSPAFDSSVVGKIAGELSVGERKDAALNNDSSRRTKHVGIMEQEQTMSSKLDDHSLIALAEEHYKQDRLLVAARFLHQVKNKDLLKHQHHDIVEKARTCENLVAQLKSPVKVGWTKQGETHGKYDTMIYYRMDPETNTKLTARVETPIEPSLLVPLLSVLNETELYPTWLPSWQKPIRLGVTRADKLRQTGRASQVIVVGADMPWPLSPREAVISALAFDDIEANGDICVKLHSLDNGEEGIVVPSQGGAVRTRVDFEGGFLFRKCPANHKALRKRMDKNMILVTFVAFVDAKVQFLPQSVINFVVRTVIGRMWDRFLNVAQDIRDGRRPEHMEAIAKKRGMLYDWVDDRVKAMFELVLEEPPGSRAIDDHPENWF